MKVKEILKWYSGHEVVPRLLLVVISLAVLSLGYTMLNVTRPPAPTSPPLQTTAPPSSGREVALRVVPLPPQFSSQISEELSVHFLDVAQGEATFVLLPNGRSMLVDGGDELSGEVVISYLEGLGVRGIDVAVATHPHTKNIAGLVPILETLPVGTVITNGQAMPSRTYEQLIGVIHEKKIPLLAAVRGDDIELDPEVKITILSPPDPPISGTSSDVNSNAIVLRLEYGGASFLFTSDIPSEGESYAMVKSGVLKVADHGSAFSTTGAFLEMVDPEIAVVMVEENAPSGYPAEETLERLERREIQVYRTDETGTITITGSDAGYNVTLYRDITAPGITVFSPEDGSEVPQTFMLKAGFDEPVEKAWYAVDGITAGEEAGNTKRVIFNLTLEEEGVHNLTLYARDAAGNVAFATRRVHVNVALPPELANVRLTYAHPKAAGGDRINLYDEYVRIANEGTVAQEIGGWTLFNQKGPVYRFPQGFSIGGENSINIRTGKGRDSEKDIYLNSDSPVWSNDGDVAYLMDEKGSLVSSLSM